MAHRSRLKLDRSFQGSFFISSQENTKGCHGSPLVLTSQALKNWPEPIRNKEERPRHCRLAFAELH